MHARGKIPMRKTSGRKIKGLGSPIEHDIRDWEVQTRYLYGTHRRKKIIYSIIEQLITSGFIYAL